MGKKKKSVANKLARMSDEERARYLQHKADVEEEARRRKEQLISTFMKNKIKKEDAFSRLNLAKINQNWHQILRRSKCLEMKENVEHMRKWIDRIISLKNRTIEKLMEELEEAELQYSHNLKYHIMWIDRIIDSHNTYLKKLDDDYDQEMIQTLETITNEQETYAKKSAEGHDHLKTIIYGQDVKALTDMKNICDHYDKIYDNLVCENRTAMEKSVKDCQTTLSGLWRQAAEIVKDYVSYTDIKRAHLAELKRLDSESSVEISRNQERIILEEQQIIKLNTEYATIAARGEHFVRSLEDEVELLTTQFSEMRVQLQNELTRDEKRLRHMTDASNRSIEYLDRIHHKGCQIIMLIEACDKLETERDKVIKYLPFSDVNEEDENLQTSHDCRTDSDRDVVETPSEDGKTSKTMSEKILESREMSPILTGGIIKSGSEPTGGEKADLRKLRERLSSDKVDTEPSSSTKLPQIRPKTTLMRRLYDKSIRYKNLVEQDSKSRKSEMTSLQKIEIREKKIASSSSMSTSSGDSSQDTDTGSADSTEKLSTWFDNLRHMEKFWRAYNKAELDTMELRAEKKVLMAENKQLRGMMRAVLEAAALAQSIPNSRVSTSVASRARTSRSAPPRRLIL